MKKLIVLISVCISFAMASAAEELEIQGKLKISSGAESMNLDAGTLQVERSIKISGDQTESVISENHSIAGGERNVSATNHSIALGGEPGGISTFGINDGNNTNADDYSIAIGSNIYATNYSYGMGIDVDSFDYCFGLGNDIMAENQSFVFGGDPDLYSGGINAKASNRSFAFGHHVYAKNYSFAFGNEVNYEQYTYPNRPLGDYSVTMGYKVSSPAFHQVTFGRYCETTYDLSSSGNSWVETDPLFVLGNGASENERSNALVVLKNGDTKVNGNLESDTLKVRKPSPLISMGKFGRQEEPAE